jgi:hypothetical protein
MAPPGLNAFKELRLTVPLLVIALEVMLPLVAVIETAPKVELWPRFPTVMFPLSALMVRVSPPLSVSSVLPEATLTAPEVVLEIVLLPVKVTGPVKVIAPVVVRLLARLIPLELVADKLVRAALPPTAPLKVIFPVPAFRVRARGVLSLLIVELKDMLPLPAEVSSVTPEVKVTGPVKVKL